MVRGLFQSWAAFQGWAPGAGRETHQERLPGIDTARAQSGSGWWFGTFFITVGPCQIEVGRFVSMKAGLFSKSMFISKYMSGMIVDV